MWNDLKTVLWKERKSMFRAAGRRSQLLFMVVTPLMLAVVIPYTMGVDWLNNAFSMAVCGITAFMIVGVMIPDSFAGERERHTLPTLLASRLPDKAILFGKMINAILVGWASAVKRTVLSPAPVPSSRPLRQ